MSGIKRDKLDAVFSNLVRERAGWKSEYSGETGHLECCHIYGRRRRSVRWHPWNAVCLTHYEHRHFTENPVLFANWCSAKFGPDRMFALAQLANTPIKFTPRQLEGLYQHYKAVLVGITDIRATPGDSGSYLDFAWPANLPEAAPRKSAKKKVSLFAKTYKRKVDGTVVKRVA